MKNTSLFFLAVGFVLCSASIADAALVSKRITGNLNIVDPEQSIWQTPEGAVFDEWGYSYQTPFEFSYTIDTNTPGQLVGEDDMGGKKYSYTHGKQPGENFTFKAAGQTWNLSSIGAGSGDFWPTGSVTNWYGLGFIAGNSSFSFLFESDDPLNPGNLTLDNVWKNSIFSNVPSSEFFASANIKSIESVNLAEAEDIPTPALLPGLIGLGIAAVKRRKKGLVSAPSIGQLIEKS